MLSAFMRASNGAEPRAADPSAVALSVGRRLPLPTPGRLLDVLHCARGCPHQPWLGSRTAARQTGVGYR